MEQKTFRLNIMPNNCVNCNGINLEVNESFFDNDGESEEYVMEVVCMDCNFSFYNVWKYSYTEYYRDRDSVDGIDNV